MKPVVLGVDGGGTKTMTVCLSLEDESVISSARSASTNWNSVGDEAAKKALQQGIRDAVQSAGMPVEIRGICLGMSGVDRPHDKIKVMEWMEEVLRDITQDFKKDWKKCIFIENDAVVALASGTRGVLEGIVVISGTGMIVYGIRNSIHKRAGGWGPFLGDQGSGFDIGLDILRAAVSDHDGRGPKTLLLDSVLKKLSLKHPDELITWAYDKNDQSWAKFADLAPIAAECARKGDLVARQILDEAADHLLKTITAVIQRLELQSKSFVLVLSGGNLTCENSKLAELLSEKMRQAFPAVKIVFPSIEIPEAAALLAKRKLQEEEPSPKKQKKH